MPNQHFLEKVMPVVAFRPVDLQTGANAGDWVSLKNYRRCAIMFHSAIGTNGDDPVLTVLQAQDVAGTGSKVLAKLDWVYVKQAATNLLAVGQWTKLAASTSSTYTQTDAAEQEALWVVDIRDELLDVNNGFDCISVSVADVGTNAQLGAAYYFLHDPRFPGAPESMLSAIVD